MAGNASCRDFINFTYARELCFYFPNFTRTELKCGCKSKYCKGYPAKVDFDLMYCLQKVREHFGKPVVVTSGLRCSKYNATLSGSSKNSAHKSGKAADIFIKGVDPKEIVSYWKSLNVGYSYCGTPNMGSAAHVQIGW